ncbi:MAG: YcxB family protein [Cytophagales bacterium]|nr:YcxB family protein [Cytophagales bacterium]MDW8384860.1 YcxB family protein [Flammeovirgaceae bacterium]
MTIRTKKYQLDHKTYINLSTLNALREFWWAWLIPVAILIIPIFYAPAFWWCLISAFLLSLLWVIFWAIQFVAVTQLEQFKTYFEKLFYEFDTRHILIKKSEREGMQITWDKIQKVRKTKDAYYLFVSRFQFLYLPFKIFQSEHDLKFFETLLKRKEFLH